MQSPIKDFYRGYHDEILKKRVESPYPVRRRVHREIYESVLGHVRPGARVLDAGCGEGVLAIMMAEKGAHVTAVDYSAPNVAAATALARARGLSPERVSFANADTENLPFADDSFDCVVSNHVLEHLPDFAKGLAEIYRVTREFALIAVPTCLNPCAFALLGGVNYWKFSPRSLVGLPFGILRVLGALAVGAEGVNEGYAGRKDIVHVFRFPWRARRAVEEAGFAVESFEAQTLCLPYLDLPWCPPRRARGLRNLGMGTLYVARKSPAGRQAA